MIYYVSANAERNGDGSKCRPFQTITEAANIARAGDIARHLVWRCRPKQKAKAAPVCSTTEEG